jgi:hypothetical protein
MKRRLLVIGMFTGLISYSLHSQTAPGMLAKIPFDFALQGTMMPAGDYTVTCSNAVVIVRQVHGSHAAMTLTTPTLEPADHQSRRTGFLLFKRYGDEYFLTDLWNPYLQSGRILPESHRLKELASRMRQNEAAKIALTKK